MIVSDVAEEESHGLTVRTLLFHRPYFILTVKI